MRNRLPVGPGSRGGQWHDPEYRARYFRRWRQAHPEYVARDNDRRRLTHACSRLARVMSGGTYERGDGMTEEMIGPDDEDTIPADDDEDETPFEEDDSDGPVVGEDTDEEDPG